MLKKLPAWKDRILRSIDSCVNPDQLDVCEEFISLFKSRYSGWISSFELAKHSMDLDEAFERKKELFNPKTINS